MIALAERDAVRQRMSPPVRVGSIRITHAPGGRAILRAARAGRDNPPL
jgi:hypothetical protein